MRSRNFVVDLICFAMSLNVETLWNVISGSLTAVSRLEVLLREFSEPISPSSSLKIEVAELSKRCSPFTELHGYTFQKTVIIIILKLTDKTKVHYLSP
jgi:hypothetical protein